GDESGNCAEDIAHLLVLAVHHVGELGRICPGAYDDVHARPPFSTALAANLAASRHRHLSTYARGKLLSIRRYALHPAPRPPQSERATTEGCCYELTPGRTLC